MTILITGANGLIGSDLVKKLSNKYKIFGYQLHNTGKIKYNKIQPSSLNTGYYAIENYKKAIDLGLDLNNGF